MVFPVVMYECKSWAIKRQNMQELMLLNCGDGEDSWESLQTLENHLKIQEIKPVNLKGNHTFCKDWSSNTLATWCKQLTHWKRPWYWERLKAEEDGSRGWDVCMALLTQWTWSWANSGRWWRTGKPVMLQSIGSWRVRHDLETDNINSIKNEFLNECFIFCIYIYILLKYTWHFMCIAR